MTSWQLFTATFFSLNFIVSLLETVVPALLMGIVLRSWFLASRFMEKKTGVPGFSEEDFTVFKQTIYLGMGALTIFYMFTTATAGLFYFPIFLGTSIDWLIAGYVLVAVTEKRFVSLKEFRDFIFPYFYVWGKKEDKKPAPLSTGNALKILFATFILLLVLSVIVSSTFS